MNLINKSLKMSTGLESIKDIRSNMIHEMLNNMDYLKKSKWILIIQMQNYLNFILN